MDRIRTPSRLTTPAFLMNFPFTVDNRYPNNALMDVKAGEYNYDAAFKQFLSLYHRIGEDAVIYLLPSEGNFQDQPYVANLGLFLPHIKDKDVILLAKFKSPPRVGEDEVGRKFFTSMEYEVHQPPFYWEGEADLKYLRDNIYIGGYGIRSDIESHVWMSNHFDMRIVSIKLTDPKLYHFDCVFFPINKEKALVATQVLDRYDVNSLERYVEIVDVPTSYLYDGWTNAVRVGDRIFHAPARTPGSEAAFKEMVYQQGLRPEIVYLWEYEKSGADLSCMCLHFNYPHLM